MCQASDDEDAESRWLRPAPPNALRDHECLADRLSLNHADGQLDQVIESCTGGGQRGLDVAAHLLGLRAEVADPDDIAIGIDGILTADVHGAMGSLDHDRLRKSRVSMEPFGLKMLDGHGVGVLPFH